MTGPAKNKNTSWSTPPGCMNLRQAADLLGVYKGAIYSLVEKQRLPEPVPYGGRSKVLQKATLLEFKRRRDAGEPTPPRWWDPGANTAAADAREKYVYERHLAWHKPQPTRQPAAKVSPAKPETFQERWQRVTAERAQNGRA